MMNYRTVVGWLLVAASLCMSPVTGWAQGPSDYPNKRIVYVAPYPPGTTTDLVARAVAHALSTSLGQPVVVENRSGAGGTIGSTSVARSAPDGYTLLQGSTSTHGINPTLYPRLSYDAVKDFEPVTLIGSSPLIVVVNPSLPIKSIQDLIAYAKAHPGELRFGSAGNGSSQHLAGELFKSLANVDMLHVPYKGGSAAMTDLLGGHISLMFEIMPTALPQIKAGRLRPLAVTSLQRMPTIMDVPTVAEAGVPGYEMTTWHGVLVPAGTPKEIVATLQTAIAKALVQPAMKEHFAELGLRGIGSTPDEFGAFIRSEIARWAPLIKKSGAHID